jgi:hypothetical protein
MLRTTIAYLLVALLLICPYLCLGEWAGVMGAHSPEVGCSCGERPETDDNAPKSPADKAPDCLCRGAILDSGRCAELDAEEPLLAIDWTIDDALSSSTGVFSSAIACEGSGHFPPVCSGRDICSLVCVLLL